MNLFLDTSVILAACASERGASRAIFELAALNGWRLLAGRYGLAEVEQNLPRLGEPAGQDWTRLRG